MFVAVLSGGDDDDNDDDDDRINYVVSVDDEPHTTISNHVLMNSGTLSYNIWPTSYNIIFPSNNNSP